MIGAPQLFVPSVPEDVKREIWWHWVHTRNITAVAESVGLDVDTCRRVILSIETVVGCVKDYTGRKGEIKTGRIFDVGRRGQYWGNSHIRICEDNYGDESCP